MTVIARWGAEKCQRLQDKLEAAVGGQSSDPEHLLDVLIAAWEEMHREAAITQGAVSRVAELEAEVARLRGEYMVGHIDGFREGSTSPLADPGRQ